jgi:secreted trypsin-like serine protease
MMRLAIAMLALAGLAQAAQAQPVPAPIPAAQDGAAPATEEEEESQGRIVGGTEARPGTAPWQAEIASTWKYTNEDTAADILAGGRSMLADKEDWEKIHRCGGVYIGENLVLTAGHCVYGKPDFKAMRFVRLGTQNLRSGGAKFDIADFRLHGEYKPGDPPQNDIAMLRITQQKIGAKTLNLRPLAIRVLGERAGDIPLGRGDRLRVTGWGRTKARNSGPGGLARDGTRNEMSPVLKQIDQRPDPAACATLDQYRDRIVDKTICAVSVIAGEDSCNGDSGGPMTRAQGPERVLVGLVSWGKGCALPGLPALYTNVSGYLTWIRDTRAELLRR